MNGKPVSLTASPEGYADWLVDLKGRIHTAQQHATLAVNRELVLLCRSGATSWHGRRSKAGARR